MSAPVRLDCHGWCLLALSLSNAFLGSMMKQDGTLGKGRKSRSGQAFAGGKARQACV
jgi:hypothetical protein